jgi:2-amino-4-hydroxy-6-hydroxymethyldihydropteridine diphosphokinase
LGIFVLILIAIGANLPSPRYGEPRATCGAALAALAGGALSIAQRSRWYKSAPAPVSDQPWFINGVIRVKTALPPEALMALLLETEEAFGRRRDLPNEPRILDLDLLAYGEVILEAGPPGDLQLPHPRLHERAFVLLPLLDVAPGWRHPSTGQGVDDMIAALAPGQQAEAIADAGGVFGTEWQEKDAL